MLDPAVLDHLNAQIAAEREAEALYLSIAAWADALAFEGLQGWALAQAADEAAHARHFLAYAGARAMATLGALPAPPATFGGYAAALQAALDAERAVSASLEALHEAAMAAGDGATCLLAQRQILDEQVPAEKALATYLLRVARGAPIDLLDAELFEEAG